MFVRAGVLLVVIGLILEVLPRGNHRTIDLGFVAVVIMIVGVLVIGVDVGHWLATRHRRKLAHRAGWGAGTGD